MPAAAALICALLFVAAVRPAAAHFATLEPPSWNPQNSGIKSGPCGPRPSGGAGTPVRTSLPPGPTQIVLRETINHLGAPFRVALSHGGVLDHFDDLVLLDHLPHNDAPLPSSGGAKEYVFNVTLPDIDCPDCTLQVLNPMTDKIPAGTCCAYGGQPATADTPTCFSVYHSCSDVAITGSQDPAAWAAGFASPAAGRSGYYGKGEALAWERIGPATGGSSGDRYRPAGGGALPYATVPEGVCEPLPADTSAAAAPTPQQTAAQAGVATAGVAVAVAAAQLWWW